MGQRFHHIVHTGNAAQEAKHEHKTGNSGRPFLRGTGESSEQRPIHPFSVSLFYRNASNSGVDGVPTVSVHSRTPRPHHTRVNDPCQPMTFVAFQGWSFSGGGPCTNRLENTTPRSVQCPTTESKQTSSKTVFDAKTFPSNSFKSPRRVFGGDQLVLVLLRGAHWRRRKTVTCLSCCLDREHHNERRRCYRFLDLGFALLLGMQRFHCSVNWSHRRCFLAVRLVFLEQPSQEQKQLHARRSLSGTQRACRGCRFVKGGRAGRTP